MLRSCNGCTTSDRIRRRRFKQTMTRIDRIKIINMTAPPANNTIPLVVRGGSDAVLVGVMTGLIVELVVCTVDITLTLVEMVVNDDDAVVRRVVLDVAELIDVVVEAAKVTNISCCWAASVDAATVSGAISVDMLAKQYLKYLGNQQIREIPAIYSDCATF